MLSLHIVVLQRGGARGDCGADATQPTEQRLVRIRDPHGHGGCFTGAWSDGAAEWSLLDDATRDAIGFVGDADDGTFFMAWTDFLSHWDDICVSRLIGDAASNPYIAQLNPGWREWSIRSEWAGKAVGTYPQCTAHCEQFQVVNSGAAACEVVVTVALPSERPVRAAAPSAYTYAQSGGVLLPVVARRASGSGSELVALAEGERIANVAPGTCLNGALASVVDRSSSVSVVLAPGAVANVVPIT